MELSIDTSTRYASIALTRHGEGLIQLSWQSAQNHTVELAQGIDTLLQRAGITPRELEAIIIAQGPGGFSALRVGMGLAKGMAVALGIPIVGIGTLEVEAYQYKDLGLAVCPMLTSSRGEVAWAIYRQAGGHWGQGEAERITPPEALASVLPRRTLICGEGAIALLPEIKSLLSQRARILEVPPPTRSAFTLAILGNQRLKKGEADDPATLQPLYLRQPSITTPKEPVPIKK